MLQLRSVSKHYHRRGKTVAALDNVTLEVATGDFVAVVGASGSGKSTLLLTCGGMLSPTAGQVIIDGKSIYDLSPESRAKLRQQTIGFVFQTFHLIPYLSAIENVQIPLLLAGATDAEQQQKAASLLDRMGLAERLDHKPCELSIGQQQRVALSRMLANDPAVILADEPTGNLDPKTGDGILDVLSALSQEGRTIIMVTHDRQAAGRAKRVLTLDDGQISTNGHTSGSSVISDA